MRLPPVTNGLCRQNARPSPRPRETAPRGYVFLSQSVLAKGIFSWRFRGLKPEVGFKPLSLLVEQGYLGERRSANRGRQPRQLIELFLGGRIHHLVLGQRLAAASSRSLGLGTLSQWLREDMSLRPHE